MKTYKIIFVSGKVEYKELNQIGLRNIIHSNKVAGIKRI